MVVQKSVAQAAAAPNADPNRPTQFALHSAFEEGAGLAEYPAAAWWLRPPASSMPSALVYPLNEVVDEHYSVLTTLRIMTFMAESSETERGLRCFSQASCRVPPT